MLSFGYSTVARQTTNIIRDISKMRSKVGCGD